MTRIRAEPVPAAYVLSRLRQLAIVTVGLSVLRRAARSGHETGAQGTDGIGLSLPRRQWPVASSARPSRRSAWTRTSRCWTRPAASCARFRAASRCEVVAQQKASRRGEGGGRAARPHAAGDVPDGRRHRAPARPAPRAAGAAERRDAPVHHQPARAPGAADGVRAALPALQHEAERAAAAGPYRERNSQYREGPAGLREELDKNTAERAKLARGSASDIARFKELKGT